MGTEAISGQFYIMCTLTGSAAPRALSLLATTMAGTSGYFSDRSQCPVFLPNESISEWNLFFNAYCVPMSVRLEISDNEIPTACRAYSVGLWHAI